MEISELDQLAPPPTLLIDVGTQLQIKIEGISSIPISSVFIGMAHEEYIIIEPPAPFTSIKHKVFPGSQFVIQYVYKGFIYAFQTKVIDMITKPVRQVFLEYPKMVADRNIRSVKRTHAFIPAVLVTKTSQQDIVLIDISKKGCRFQFPIAGRNRNGLPRKGENIILKCRFPGVEGDNNITGIIRNYEKKKESLHYGVEFKAPPKNFQSIIANYILSVEEFR